MACAACASMPGEWNPPRPAEIQIFDRRGPLFLKSLRASLRYPVPLLRTGGSEMTEPTDVDNELAVTSRRDFLRESGALMGGAVLGGLAGSEALAATAPDDAGNLPPNIPEWMKTPGAPMGEPALWHAVPVREGRDQEHSEEPEAISSPPPGARRCRISTASSRRTGCSTNAIMAAFPRSIRRSIG